MPEHLSTLLEGLIEVERNYKQTLQDEREIEHSQRRIRLMEKMRMLSNGTTAELDDAAEEALKLDVDHLAHRDEWTENDVGEIIHKYQDVQPRSSPPA